jgi:hypothetical protein
VDDAIKNGPASDIEKGIDKYFGDTIRKMADLDPRKQQVDDELDKAQKNYDYSLQYRGEGEDTDRARQRLDAAREAKNGLYGDARTKFMGDLGNQPKLVAKIADLAEKNPNDFGPGGKQFAQDLKDAGKSKDEKKEEDDYAKAEEFGQQRERDFEEHKLKAEYDAAKKEEDDYAKAEEFGQQRERDFEEHKLKAEYDAWVDEEKNKKKAADKAAKDAEKADKKAEALADKEAIWGNQDLMGQIDDRMEALRSERHTSSEITGGGSSFAAKIQGGVSNENIQKNQLKTLEAIKDILAKRNEDIQRDAARFN